MRGDRLCVKCDMCRWVGLANSWLVRGKSWWLGWSDGVVIFSPLICASVMIGVVRDRVFAVLVRENIVKWWGILRWVIGLLMCLLLVRCSCVLCGSQRGVGISVPVVSGNVILAGESVWTRTSWWSMITLRRLSRWSTVPSTRFC